MILPGNYANGFAPRDGRPLYPSLWTGIAAAWCPSLGPTASTLIEHSPNKNYGAISGAVFSQCQGKYALNFDGVDDVVNVSTVSIGSVDWTVSFWLRPAANTTNAGYLTSTTNRFCFNAGTQYRAGSTPVSVGTIAVGTLAHVAWTRYNSEGVVYAYLNGNLVTSASVVTFADINKIGNDSAGAGRFYTGEMDDIRIYRRVLGSSEIKLLASRRGISYELAPRRRTGESQAAFNRRRRLLTGAA